MTTITWNLNHRIQEKDIPTHLVPSLLKLNPDIFVLNEFVDGPSRAPFFRQLEEAGFKFKVSSPTPRQNQILIASRLGSIEVGAIRGPKITEAFPSNVLHVKTGDLEVLGLRIPDYSKTPQHRVEAWDWILEVSKTLKNSRSIILGDLNTDPSYPTARCGHYPQKLVDEKWTFCLPESGCSYWTLKGDGKRIDHAFLSPSLKLEAADYVHSFEDAVFLGAKGVRSLSDHAPLRIKFR